MLTNGANVRSQDEIKINKTGNAAPVAVLKSQPASWNIMTDGVLKLDARESYDPEGDDSGIRLVGEQPWGD